MKLPQVHVRDLLWLVALVAMGCAWWVERQRTVPQAVPTPPSQVGRWELIIDKNGKETLIDTATGVTWTYSNYNWTNRRSPPTK